MRNFSVLIAALFFLTFVNPALVHAHPGRTDAYGCHTCRTNCPSWGLSYNEYHCHGVKEFSQPEGPIKSTYGSGDTGYTEPAPEYRANILLVGEQVKIAVISEKTAYYNNPHWFREKLISRLTTKFGPDYSIGYYIYTLLPDIK